jgi:hypothetical protein
MLCAGHMNWPELSLFSRNLGIVGSNLTQGMDFWCVCMRLFCVCAVLCLGSGLVTC